MGPREATWNAEHDIGRQTDLGYVNRRIARLADALEEALKRWRESALNEHGVLDGTYDDAVAERLRAVLNEAG